VARSLRWKLLAWYALMMAGLACASGYLLYANVRRSTEREIDGRLWGHAIELSQVIVPAGEGWFEIELTPQQVELFRTEGDGALHYAIWKADGKAIDQSQPSLSIPRPRLSRSRDRDIYREVSLRGPGDTIVLVGQDVRALREQLRNLAVLTFATTAAAVVLMLAGGWFLTGRALAPINRISRDAAAVSASNLSQRIDVTRMETELAELAGTINDAFDRLQRAFEQQTRFTADASHELRTPLSVVLSQAELALRQRRSEDEYREMIEAIRRAAQRMKGVVEGLLTLARADAGEMHLKTEGFDLREIVADTCQLLQPLAKDEQVTITHRLAPAPVLGDRDRLSEAVANILSNAIRYNRPGGRVDVTLKAGGDDVSLRIADNGPGIPEADRELIFDRFYRVDKARSRSIDGSGLGLAITKWIIDAHGGSISCRNAEQGGTVFDVRLRRYHPEQTV
jgi:two-component system OmpR family sensor kinase